MLLSIGNLTIKSLLALKNLTQLADKFYNAEVDERFISKNGFELVASICSKKKNKRLNDLKFENYQTASVKSTFKLEK